VYFEGEEEEKGLDTVKAAVDKVAKEEIICLRTLPTYLEQFFQVVELAMYVSAYSDGCIHPLHVALLHQYLACQLTQLSYLVFSN
jgi:hypothetical protein